MHNNSADKSMEWMSLYLPRSVKRSIKRLAKAKKARYTAYAANVLTQHVAAAERRQRKAAAEVAAAELATLAPVSAPSAD